MINLLPPDLKAEYRLARWNSRLAHVIVVLGFGFVGLAAIAAAGMLYIHQASNTYTAQAEELEQSLAEQKQGEVREQAQDISNSLKLAVQVLSQEVQFSRLLKQLAVAIPKDVSLTGITISDLQGAVDISARTVDYNAGTQLQVNLADPANKIFSKADILSIGCSTDVDPGSAMARYPCSVSIRAQFADNNPFLFINGEAKE